MERESLESGIIQDSILGKFFFGMSREQFDSTLAMNLISSDKYYFNADGVKEVPFSISPNYFNDSLYRITLHAFQYTYKYYDFLALYKLKYNMPDTVIKRENNIENYWFRGNLKIVLEKAEEHPELISIRYIDLRRNKLDTTIVNAPDNILDRYTRDYYKKYYKPQKIKTLNDM